MRTLTVTNIQCQVVSARRAQSTCLDPYAVVKRSNATRSFPILTDWKDRFIEAYDIELTHWVKTLEEKGEAGWSVRMGRLRCLRRSRHAQPFPRHESVPADRDDG